MTQQAEADPADYLGATWSSDDNSSLAELEKDCRETSTMLARNFKAMSCEIHERCDGNCMGVAETKTTSQDVTHDVQWLEQQNPPLLLYSPDCFDASWFAATNWPMGHAFLGSRLVLG